jgi:hypothetical protein
LIKEESTSELLRFTIKHILNQVHNQPEYLVLKQAQQQQKQVQNNHQQQLHNPYGLQHTTSSHQQHLSKLSRTKNIPAAKMILSETQTNWTGHNDNVWNTIQAESSEIFREQQAARQPDQYYLQQEQATDDNMMTMMMSLT